LDQHREASPTEVEPQDSEAGHDAITRLADEILPVLIARLGVSGLGELEVRQDGWRVRLRRDTNGGNGAEGASGAGGSTHSGGGSAGSAGSAGGQRPRGTDRAGDRRHDGGHGGEGGGSGAGRRERGRRAITSPAVGFYLPKEGLAVGAAVREGDLLGHVEVLGVRQDVVAPENGMIASLVAQSGEAVEYGQPLLRIEPEGRG
jgi:acetyl-CoA carboxylase biotin carboxyl carrier protein